uniref:Uncharacterized protein n=1 Tax=Globodera rostochiensis TaxID=31243 RepID=A0A914I3H7_GLORO
MTPLRFVAVFLLIALFALVGLNNAQKGPENAADAFGEPNEAASPVKLMAMVGDIATIVLAIDTIAAIVTSAMERNER